MPNLITNLALKSGEKTRFKENSASQELVDGASDADYIKLSFSAHVSTLHTCV